MQLPRAAVAAPHKVQQCWLKSRLVYFAVAHHSPPFHLLSVFRKAPIHQIIKFKNSFSLIKLLLAVCTRLKYTFGF